MTTTLSESWSSTVDSLKPHRSAQVDFDTAAFDTFDQIDWSQIEEELATHLEFANGWEENFARLLDAYDIPWQYKPRTFAVEWDDEGNFVDSFTPDFYLPSHDLYIELASPGRDLCAEKARKVRLLRQQYAKIRVELWYRGDYQNAVEQFGLHRMKWSPNYAQVNVLEVK